MASSMDRARLRRHCVSQKVWAHWRSSEVSGARPSKSSLQKAWYACMSSWGMTMVRPVSPWRIAFSADFRFPSSVRGPVDFDWACAYVAGDITMFVLPVKDLADENGDPIRWEPQVIVSIQ